MSIQTVVHINFRGEARPALSFYQSVFGGDLVVLTHAQIYGTTDPGQSPFFASVSGNASDEITSYWDKLQVDAEIVQDLAPAGWSPLYGMLKDRFGITRILGVQSSDAH